MFDYLKWLLNFRCKHERVRCLHGDEVIMLFWTRAACLDCPKLFKALPEYCSVTGERHLGLWLEQH